jgi:hypothetical protein
LLTVRVKVGILDEPKYGSIGQSGLVERLQKVDTEEDG